LAATSVIAAILRAGIENKDIQTTDLSLRPHYDYKSGRKLSHFSAEQSFTVTLREITKLDSLLDVMVQAGANEIDSVEYKTNELRKYRDQARSEAIKAAQEKAADLAKALGQGIGKAYSIEEVPDYNYQWGGGVTANTFIPSRSSSSGDSTTAPGEKVVKASVTVTFDLI
ncbi:MAG TPA: SIMPL domain-containing protein, partial [Terriglobales bacterium]